MKFAHRHVYEIDRIDTALQHTTNHPILSRLQSYAKAVGVDVLHKLFENCLDEKSPIDYSTGRERIEHIL